MYYDLYYCYCIMNTLFLHGENLHNYTINKVKSTVECCH